MLLRARVSPSGAGLSLAALLLLTLPGCHRPEAGIPEGGPVVLVVVDTLRADHLGLYGYPRPTSPALDRLAARSLVFERSYSHFSYTWPTISNLFTGIPYSRLVDEQHFVAPPKDLTGGGLAPANNTLAEQLARSGVRTFAVSANPYVNSGLGFDQGFDRFHDVYTWNPQFWKGPIHKYSAEEVNAVALPMLRELSARTEPWFLYLHYFDPHMPYTPSAEDRRLFTDSGYARTGRVVDGYLRDPRGDFLSYLTPELADWISAEDLSQLIGLYDGEIRRVDRALGELLAELARLGMDDDVTVVITADHGEAFHERRFWGHGFLSRDEEERVPLLVVPPRNAQVAPRRIAAPVTTADIYYSLLRHFGIPAVPQDAARWWAHDLLRAEVRRQAVYTEGGNGARIVRSSRLGYFLYSGFASRKLPIPTQDGEFLFDRQSDPGEVNDLVAHDPALAPGLRQRLLEAAGVSDLAGWPVPPAIDPLAEGGEESRRRLRALGYL